MIAAIMCGGKGDRMRSYVKIEKPLLKLNGKPMIERVLGSVIKSEEFRKIIAVTSHHTPTTESFVVRNFSRCVDVIRSEGQGYSEDTSVVIDKLKPERVLVVPADLPLLDSKLIKKIVSKCNDPHPCTSVICGKSFVYNLGIRPSITVCINSTEFCHTGISVMDCAKIDTRTSVRECYILMNQIGVAVNVNTGYDLRAAERLMMCHS